MSNFAFISNGAYVNQYDSEVRVTAAVIGTETNEVDLYSTVFTVQAGNMQISLDPVLGKTKTINDIINKRGFLGGSTSSEVQLNPKTTSITLKTDYVFLTATKKGIEMSSNIIEAMLKGEGFVTDGGYKKVVGTNGTYKRGFNTNQNRFFGKLFELDGRLVIADASTAKGDAVTVANIRTPADNKTCNLLIFEVISKFDDETADGIRLVYTMNSDVNWGDANDANEITMTQTQLCDARFIENFFIEGFEESEYGAAIPARRTRFNKRPVNIFKGYVNVTSGVIDGYTDLDKTLEAGVSFTQPDEVIEIDLTRGDAVHAIYEPALKDIVELYIPATATTNPGYALAVCTTVADYAYANVGDINAVSDANTFTILGDVSVGLTAGDKLRVTVDVGQYEILTVVSATYDGLTETTIVVEEDMTAAVTAGDTVDERTLTTGALFQLINNDYTLTEKVVYNTLPAPATLADALFNVYDYNFEETIFKVITE